MQNKHSPLPESYSDWNISSTFSSYLVLVISLLTLSIIGIGYFSVKRAFTITNDAYADIEINSVSSIFNNYLENHLAALQDHAGNPLVINASMNSLRQNPILVDTLNELRLVGKSAAFFLFDINGELVTSTATAHSLGTSQVDAVYRVIDEQTPSFVHLQSAGSNTNFVIASFIVPVLYNGLSEGALLAETQIQVDDIIDLVFRSTTNIKLSVYQGDALIYDGQSRAMRHFTESSSRLKYSDIGLTLRVDTSQVNSVLKNLTIQVVTLTLVLTILFLVVFQFIGRKLFIEPNRVIHSEREKATTLNKQLLRANEDLGQFAYIASHDLKSPLLSISQLAGWIIEDCESLLPDDSKKHLGLLQSRISRMHKLLDDLLEYSRAGRLQYDTEAIHPRQMASAIFETLNNAQNFTLECIGEPETIFLPKTPVELTMRNLFSNAIKHHHQSSGHIQLHWHTSNGLYVISVKDDGPGIDKPLQQKAFDMFQTLQPRDEVEGSGMGLSLIKKIVESYSGSVEMHSASGEGTTLITRWPIPDKGDNDDHTSQ